MSDLAKQIAEMRAMLEALQPKRAGDALRPYFADAAYDGHRDAIIAALLEGRGYSFTAQLPEDPDGRPSWFYISWPDRSQPPVRLRICYVRDWRGVKYGSGLGMSDLSGNFHNNIMEVRQGTDASMDAKAAPAPSQTHTAPIVPATPAEPELASELETLVEPEPPTATATATQPTVPTVEELRAKAQRLADQQNLIFGRVDPRSLL